jgi:hypothetical protein
MSSRCFHLHLELFDDDFALDSLDINWLAYDPHGTRRFSRASSNVAPCVSAPRISFTPTTTYRLAKIGLDLHKINSPIAVDYENYEGQAIASRSISPIHAALRWFQDILEMPISSDVLVPTPNLSLTIEP